MKLNVKEKMGKQRTNSQNNSLHLYLTWVAREMVNNGICLQDVVRAIKKVEIVPTPQNLKEVVWREIQKIMFKKESTTFLTKHEISEVYEVMSMWLAKNFEISLPFPNDDGESAPLTGDNYENTLRNN